MYQFQRSSSQYSNHSSSAPGSTKNSSSICSNSRVRKIKLPGVISFRKDLPICAIPKGTFTRLVCNTFLKLTNIPCAVSGLKYATFSGLLTGPVYVSNIRLKGLTGAKSRPPSTGSFIRSSCSMISVSFSGERRSTSIPVASLRAPALDEHVVEAREVPGGLPNFGVHDDGGVQAHDVVSHLKLARPP